MFHVRLTVTIIQLRSLEDKENLENVINLHAHQYRDRKKKSHGRRAPHIPFHVCYFFLLRTVRQPTQRNSRWHRPAFLKLWSANHKWSSGSALVVLLD
jgi:hypothetical protein